MATERGEDYLETIEGILQERGSAKPKDIREALGLGSSTVTEMLQKMAISGLINYEKYRDVTLTDKGRRIARQIQKRHDMLKAFLLSIGVSERVADKDACMMEHILSRETLSKLRALSKKGKSAAKPFRNA